MKLFLKLTVLFSMYGFLTYGVTRHVPGTYPTIQAALNACISGDTVRVQPGVYVENIIWPLITQNIKLLSDSGSAHTTISGGSTDRVLYINSAGLDTNTVISGFKITDGYITSGSGYGAGVHVTNTSLLFQDVVITGNRVYTPGSHGHGAGLFLNNSSSVFRNCTISNNSIDSATWCYGAGVFIQGGFPVFSYVTIANNSSHAANWCYGVGLYATNGTLLTMSEVKVTGNFSGDDAIWYYGTGIYLDDVTGTLTNLLVASNVSGTGGNFNNGGGIYFNGSLTNMNIINCTVTDNSKSGNGTINGTGIYVRDATVNILNSILFNSNTGMELITNGTGNVFVTYSNVRGGFAGIGNINVLPGFVSAVDFKLSPLSLCAGTGTANGAALIDLEGISRPLPLLTLPDMGCYEIDQTATGLSASLIDTKALNVYPNPVISGEVITIENTRQYLKITDITGKVVYETIDEAQITEISTSGWNSGWYFIYSPGQKAKKLAVISQK